MCKIPGIDTEEDKLSHHNFNAQDYESFVLQRELVMFKFAIINEMLVELTAL